MAEGATIQPDDILLRRLPPPQQEAVTDEPGRGRRANSNKLGPRPRKDFDGASYSRFPPTSPLRILDLLYSQKLPPELSDPKTWLVCWIRAREAMDIGLILTHDPDPPESDPGHCFIDSEPDVTKGKAKRMWKRLADRTFGRVFDYSTAERIITPSDLPGWIE